MKTIQITVVGLLLLGTYSCKETKKEADKVGNEIEQSTDQMEQGANDMIGQRNCLWSWNQKVIARLKAT